MVWDGEPGGGDADREGLAHGDLLPAIWQDKGSPSVADGDIGGAGDPSVIAAALLAGNCRTAGDAGRGRGALTGSTSVVVVVVVVFVALGKMTLTEPERSSVGEAAAGAGLNL